MRETGIEKPSAVRKIIHCDCDCFYAAIEMRDNPQLKHRAVAVGGEAHQRGVICTANYEARRFGVRSAMPTVKAMQLCPELVLLPVDMEKYHRESKRILAIYQEYSPLIEPLSLDEAYIDVTGSSFFQGSATHIAQAIRARVFHEIGITVSAGIAPNKFLAKVASDWQKPNGCFTIAPPEVDGFIKMLPVKKIFGVGPVTAQKMQGMGIQTCADLQALSIFDLRKHFGQFGQTLHDLCRGIDHRKVTPAHIRKSISVEETYPRDLAQKTACHLAIRALFGRLENRIRGAQSTHLVSKLFLKVRFEDFRSTTVETVENKVHPDYFCALFDAAYERAKKPVRLLGLGVRLSASGVNDRQQDLFNQ